MSQPPKSTMRAPAARWMALSGVFFSTEGLRCANSERGGSETSLSPRLSSLPERFGVARRAMQPRHPVPLRWTAKAQAVGLDSLTAALQIGVALRAVLGT